MTFSSDTSNQKEFCPEVSIIVPIYNAEALLGKCLVSIQNQTFSNYEVILIDDGSTDNSLFYAKKYADEDQRIKLISQDNAGVSIARNKGLEVACGKWVMFVDSDDSLDNTILENLLKNSDDTVDIIACCCQVFFPDKECEDSFFAGNRMFVTAEEKKELYLQLLNPSYGQPGKMYTAIGVPWGKLYRRSFLERNNLRFNTNLRRLQDNIFNMYAFYAARKISYIDEALYNYRYEHLGTLYSSYNSGLTNALCTYMQERFLQLRKLMLFDDSDICTFYKNECIKRMIIILRNEWFNYKDQSNKSLKIDKADEICNLECFQFTFSQGHISDFSSLKYRCVFFLLKLHQYRLCYLLIMGEQNIKQLRKVNRK